MPVIADGGKTWTITLDEAASASPTIPAFKGKPRELVADDYVYSIKRALDPNLRGGGDPALTDLHRRRAADRRRGAQARRQVRLRRADRGPAGARPLHAASCGSTEPDYTLLERLAGLTVDGGRARGDRGAPAPT